MTIVSWQRNLQLVTHSLWAWNSASFSPRWGWEWTEIDAIIKAMWPNVCVQCRIYVWVRCLLQRGFLDTYTHTHTKKYWMNCMCRPTCTTIILCVHVCMWGGEEYIELQLQAHWQDSLSEVSWIRHWKCLIRPFTNLQVCFFRPGYFLHGRTALKERVYSRKKKA